MCVGRKRAWRIDQEDISTDACVGAVWMEHDSILHQVRAILETLDLVDHTLMSDLCV